MSVDVRAKVGERIRNWRERNGMSQQQLCDQAVLTQANLSKIENGEANVTLRTLYRIAKALDIKFENLTDTVDYSFVDPRQRRLSSKTLLERKDPKI